MSCDDAPTLLATAYEYATLDGLIGEVAGLLAELRYIDAALGYIAQRQFVGPQVAAEQALSIEIPLGTVYPFTRILTVPVTGWNRHTFWRDEEAEQVSKDLADLAEGARQWAIDEVAMLRYKIAPMVHTDTGDFAGIDDELLTVHHLVEGLKEDIGALGVSIDEWVGDAARNFRRSFYLPFGEIRFYQLLLVKWLREGLSATKAITDLAQYSLMEVVTGTKRALCEQLQLRAADSDQDSAQGVRFLAFATGLFSALTFELPPLSASLAVLSVASDYAADEVERDRNTLPYEIKGRTAEELSGSLFEAVQRVLDNVALNHDELESRLRELRSLVAGYRRVDPDRGHSYLIVSRPDLVEGVDPDEFYHDSSSR